MSQVRTIKAKGKVFRDPVHRLIRIDPDDSYILDLIDTPEFQRLRRIRQLGVSSLTYHGAEHSRFSHSMGVFNFAQRILHALFVRYAKESAVHEVLERHSKVIKAAALLHDLGHGPFSHVIERARSAPFKHEQMTVRLIKDSGSGVNAALKRAGIDPEAVANVIDGTYPCQLAKDIVSSQLDADRMDYLLRDSLMAGVEYGAYDSEWLLNAMCVGRDPSADSQDGLENALRLCLDRNRGLLAAEQLILARYHMSLQVYMHRVTRGYEVMLLMLFKRAGQLAGASTLPSSTPDSVREYLLHGIGMLREDWLEFDESALIGAMHLWARTHADAVLMGLSRAYLTRTRLLRGFSIGHLDHSKTIELTQELVKADLKRGVDWELDNGEHLPYKGVWHSASKPGGPEEGSSVSVLLSDGSPDFRAVPAEGDSRVLKALDADRRMITRLYMDRSRESVAMPILNSVGVYEGDSA